MRPGARGGCEITLAATHTLNKESMGPPDGLRPQGDPQIDGRSVWTALRSPQGTEGPGLDVGGGRTSPHRYCSSDSVMKLSGRCHHMARTLRMSSLYGSTSDTTPTRSREKSPVQIPQPSAEVIDRHTLCLGLIIQWRSGRSGGRLSRVSLQVRM